MHHRHHLIRLLALLLFTLWAGAGMAQEVCDNGLDDDGDGLTDLRDTADCRCRASARPVSRIKNPSFETYTECPFALSLIDYAPGWFDVNQGTSDFFHKCGFQSSALRTQGLANLPDGQGCAGVIITSNYQEYVGTCLDSALRPGRPYTLRFDVASTPIDGEFASQISCRGGAIFYDTIALTLYGRVACPTRVVPVLGCVAQEAGSGWVALGSVSYVPQARWSGVQIRFSPGTSISALALSGPCQLPDSYTTTGSCAPYFFFDNLLLGTAEAIARPWVEVRAAGSLCQGDLRLRALTPDSAEATASYQWYRNGVALPGQTTPWLAIPSADSMALGDYQVRLVRDGACALSAPYTLQSLPPRAGIAVEGDSIVVAGASRLLRSTGTSGAELSWLLCDSSRTNAPTVTATFRDTGRCCITLIARQGSCADTAVRCFQVIDKPSVLVPNLFTPNGDGRNDRFALAGAGLQEVSCTLYDRWGRQVYQWQGVAGGWDGKVSGQRAPSGTYYYTLRYQDVEGKATRLQGWVELVGD